MFDLDPGKLIVIGIVALVAIPTKDLPRVLRQIGQLTGRMRRMAAEFQGQFMDAMREAEIADVHKDLKSEVDSAFAGVGKDVAFDPLKEAREQIVGAIEGPPAATQTGEPESTAVEPAPEAPAVLDAAPAPEPASEAATPPESQPK
ncbi:twin-arginine translocase subunit TatB [Methylosinus sp. H3A]|uniref:Sec-independent protein translocase subunit TatA/TatB n=1 Tax=Methylosinus sp. H3A TaxID=2785786 RepID=UPI0018C2B3F5|nr:twin-arginine translocase subunit TatB [Methylosinus sp. H3A]MBG0811520.1 twin-arginine translocase subunit TatB [Methylosinus sp. H3A]